MKKRIALVLALILAFTLTGCKSSDYKSALEAMNNGNYETAAQQLEALGDYKESQQMLRQCRYALAVEDFNSENFEKAAEEFRNLGDYLDAASYVTRAEDGMIRQKIVGTWHSETVDLTDVMLAAAEAQMEGITDSLKEQNVRLDMTLDVTFREDGTCSVTGSFGDIDGFMEKVKSFFASFMESMLTEELATEGMTLQDAYDELDVTNVDELFQAIAGMTISEFTDSLGLKEILQQAEESMTSDGRFTVEKGVILCSGDEIRYDAAQDTLSLQPDDELQQVLGLESLTLNRVK